MRSTKLHRADGATLIVATDDRGTTVLGADDAVLSERGSDFHDAEVARLGREGWTAEPQPRPALVAVAEAIPEAASAGSDDKAGDDKTGTVQPGTG